MILAALKLVSLNLKHKNHLMPHLLPTQHQQPSLYQFLLYTFGLPCHPFRNVLFFACFSLVFFISYLTSPFTSSKSMLLRRIKHLLDFPKDIPGLLFGSYSEIKWNIYWNIARPIGYFIFQVTGRPLGRNQVRVTSPRWTQFQSNKCCQLVHVQTELKNDFLQVDCATIKEVKEEWGKQYDWTENKREGVWISRLITEYIRSIQMLRKEIIWLKRLRVEGGGKIQLKSALSEDQQRLVGCLVVMMPDWFHE